MTAGTHNLHCEPCHTGTAWQSLAGGASWPGAAASAVDELFLCAYDRTWWCDEDSILHVNCGSCLTEALHPFYLCDKGAYGAPHLSAVYRPALVHGW